MYRSILRGKITPSLFLQGKQANQEVTVGGDIVFSGPLPPLDLTLGKERRYQVPATYLYTIDDGTGVVDVYAVPNITKTEKGDNGLCVVNGVLGFYNNQEPYVIAYEIKRIKPE